MERPPEGCCSGSGPISGTELYTLCGCDPNPALSYIKGHQCGSGTVPNTHDESSLIAETIRNRDCGTGRDGHHGRRVVFEDTEGINTQPANLFHNLSLWKSTANILL